MVFIVAVPLAHHLVFVAGLGYLSIAMVMIIAGIFATIVGIVWLRRIIEKVR